MNTGKRNDQVMKIPLFSLLPFIGYRFDTEDGDKLLPGFLDSLIGIQRGETKSFPLVFPESWNQEDLRGVHAQFTVSFLFICSTNEEIINDAGANRKEMSYFIILTFTLALVIFYARNIMVQYLPFSSLFFLILGRVQGTILQRITSVG